MTQESLSQTKLQFSAEGFYDLVEKNQNKPSAVAQTCEASAMETQSMVKNGEKKRISRRLITGALIVEDIPTAIKKTPHGLCIEN